MAAEVWESFLTEQRLKGGEMFLLCMNPLVVRGKAGWIPFFHEIFNLFYMSLFPSWWPFIETEEQTYTKFQEIQNRCWYFELYIYNILKRTHLYTA